MTEQNELKTITEIADLLEEPPHRISYVVSKLRLKPIKRVGIIRLFNDQQILRVKAGCYNLQVKTGGRLYE